MKKYLTFLTAAAAILLMTFPASAAELETLVVTGRDSIPEKTWEQADKRLGEIPKEVFIAFTGYGGTVRILEKRTDMPKEMQFTLAFYEEGDWDPAIYICAADVKDDPELLAMVIAHEMTHFGFDLAKTRLSAAERKNIAGLTVYYGDLDESELISEAATDYYFPAARKPGRKALKALGAAVEPLMEQVKQYYAENKRILAQNASARIQYVVRFAKITMPDGTQYWWDPERKERILITPENADKGYRFENLKIK